MKEAKDLLKHLREGHPSDPLVLLWQGRSDEALGNRKDAESAYLLAIKMGRTPADAVDAYVALAHLLSGVGRTDDANTRLAEASSKFPDSPALHRAKGDVALRMGRYDEAKKDFEAGLALDDDISTRFRLGIALRHLKQYDDASRAFDKVAASDKDFPGLALERGIVFEETGHSDKALDAYRRALEKAPDDVDLKLRVGSTQVLAGHGKEAESILQEVRRARPNSAEVNHFLGRAILLKGGSAAEAVRYLEAAVNVDSNRAEYFLYLGWAANQLGGTNSGKARAALDRAIELVPTSSGMPIGSVESCCSARGRPSMRFKTSRRRCRSDPPGSKRGPRSQAATKTFKNGPKPSRRGAKPLLETTRLRNGTTDWANSSRAEALKPLHCLSWKRRPPSVTDPSNPYPSGCLTPTC